MSTHKNSDADEQALADYLKTFDMVAEPGLATDYYDFMVYDFETELYRAIAEVKRVGKKTYKEHDDTVMPMTKFINLKNAAAALGLRFWYFILTEDDQGADAFYLADLTNFKPQQISRNGRKDRGRANDIRHLIHIPLSRFGRCDKKGSILL